MTHNRNAAVATVAGLISMGIIFPVILFAVAALQGLALWLMWSWFLVPIGLPPVSFLMATGIVLTVDLVMPSSGYVPDDHKIKYLLNNILLKPMCDVAMGFVIKVML